MKKLIKISVLSVVLAAGALTVQSFTTATSKVEKISNVEFKVINDTGSEYKYCVNGGHNYISAGASKGFSYSEGTEIKHIDGSNCGKTWFKVTSSMNGKSFKISELNR